jgi:hypothetical protein
MLMAMQAAGNKPTSMRDLMFGLYGSPNSYSEVEAAACCNEIAAILTTCHQLGWITDPFRAMHEADGGTIILTDIGDEKATALRDGLTAIGVPVDDWIAELLHATSDEN